MGFLSVSVAEQAVAADLVRLGGLRGSLAAAGDAVGESPEGGYLRQRVALVEGFVDGDVGEGRPSSSRNMAYRSPVGWVWCSSS
jgi:hypothetical protein